MDEIDEALRLADGLDLDDGQWIVDALAAEVRRLRDEVDRYRAHVTTGGPGVPFTEQWENGPSSRPSTAPPEAVVVALPEGFGEWCSEHGEEMQDHEHAVDYVDEPPPL